jgi:hypothetical protein
MAGWSNCGTICQVYGEEAAKELALFRSARIYAMKEVVLKEKLDCDLLLTRSCEAFLFQDLADAKVEKYQKLLDDGVDWIKDVQYISPKYAERVSDTLHIPITPHGVASQKERKLSPPAFRNQERKSRYHNHSRPTLALQIRDQSPRPFNRADNNQRTDPHTRNQYNDQSRRYLPHPHPSRRHSRQKSSLRHKRLHSRNLTLLRINDRTNKDNMLAHRHSSRYSALPTAPHSDLRP